MARLLLWMCLNVMTLGIQAQTSYYYAVEKTVAPGQKAYILYNKKGVQLIPAKHEWISVNQWKWIFVWDHKTAVVYDSLGKSLGIEGIEEGHYISKTSELIPLRKKGLWGYYSRNGVLKIPHLYEEAALFEKGEAAVKLHGKYCYIDTKGNVLDKTPEPSAADMLKILETSAGLTTFSGYPQELVEEKGKVGLRKKSNGKLLLKCEYDGLYCITDEAVIAEKKGKYGVVDFKGHVLIPIEQEMIYLLGD